MYLHIGGDAAVRDEDILAVFDMDNATASHITRAALRRAEREKKVINTMMLIIIKQTNFKNLHEQMF